MTTDKYNSAISVAFSVDHDCEDPIDLPVTTLIAAAIRQLHELLLEPTAAAKEAFEVRDTCTNYKNSPPKGYRFLSSLDYWSEFDICVGLSRPKLVEKVLVGLQVSTKASEANAYIRRCNFDRGEKVSVTWVEGVWVVDGVATTEGMYGHYKVYLAGSKPKKYRNEHATNLIPLEPFPACLPRLKSLKDAVDARCLNPLTASDVELRESFEASMFEKYDIEREDLARNEREYVYLSIETAWQAFKAGFKAASSFKGKKPVVDSLD